MFRVHCVDTSTGQETLVGTAGVSGMPESGPPQPYAAGIGGLESHRTYRIEVSTVTQRGIESCERAAVTAQTGDTFLFYRELTSSGCCLSDRLRFHRLVVRVGGPGRSGGLQHRRKSNRLLGRSPPPPARWLSRHVPPADPPELDHSVAQPVRPRGALVQPVRLFRSGRSYAGTDL